MEEGQDCGALGRVLGLLRWEDVCSSPSLGLGPFLSHFLSNDSLHLCTCEKPDYNPPRLDSKFILQIKYFLNTLPYIEFSRNVATMENEDRKHFLWCEAFVRNFTILKTHTPENNAASSI